MLDLGQGVGSRPDSRLPFCARQKGTFTLAWGGTHIAKQCEWRPKSASATLSGETLFAPSSLRSNSRRKYEFLCRGTPVFQLACGVAQALRPELLLPLAGEGVNTKFIAASAFWISARAIFHSEILRLIHLQLPSTCAEERSLRGGMCGSCRTCFVHLTRRNCLSEALLKRVASFAAHPTGEHRRLPAAQRRDAGSRVAFLLVPFRWRNNEKELGCRAETRFPPSTEAHRQTRSRKANFSPKRREVDAKAPIPAFPQRGKEWHPTSATGLAWSLDTTNFRHWSARMCHRRESTRACGWCLIQAPATHGLSTVCPTKQIQGMSGL